MRWRDAFVGGLVPLLAAGLTALPALDRLEGLSIDVLFWLRHQVYGPLHRPEDSPSVVIGIDEETYRRPPFEGLPKVMWTPQLARVIEAAIAGGARVIGQDVILSTSIEAHVPGFDRPYLLALRAAAREGRIVLSKVQHLKKPLSPFPGYSFAVDHERNIRLANLFRDGDGTIRRVPLTFRNVDPEGTIRIEPSISVELAARALGESQVAAEREVVALGDYAIPGSIDNALLLNFDGGGKAIPVYSLADVHACAEAGETAFFRKHFDGKVVLIGTVLDVEDRKITSNRFVTGPEGAWQAERCVFPVMTQIYDQAVVRDSIPAAFLFATAVNNLLRRDALRELSPPLHTALVLVLALAVAVAVMVLRPWPASSVIAAGAVIWAGVTVVGFRDTLVLPLLDPLAAGAIVLAVLLGYRFGVADREKRQIRQAFSYYLPAPVIDRMLRRDQTPSLGGETRELTVWFSDLAGFAALSEGMSPKAVVSLLNEYLSAMTDIVEEHGGFVDKYVGDAIVAVFGAPVEVAEHARQAAKAALACQHRLRTMRPSLALPPGRRLAARIGINSGEMLIGNIGSRRRFNYTVMGDAVNQASRLEGVNKVYGTSILASERTAQLCGPEVVFREIDLVRVVGRQEPVRVFELVGLGEDVTREQLERHQQFAQALAEFRARRFEAAAEMFANLVDEDPVARLFEERARAYQAAVLPPDWAGVHTLEQK